MSCASTDPPVPTDRLPIRAAARVLLVDPADRVLLFRSLPRPDGSAFWYPVGGEVEAGESHEAAARREAREETGLSELALGPEVLRRRFVFPWRGAVFDARERWWLARVAAFDPDFSAMEALERREFSDCRWMSLGDLAAVAAAGDVLVPLGLLELLPGWLAGEFPAVPAEVDE